MNDVVKEDDIEKKLATALFITEKELGGAAQTKEDSLLLKFYSQVEEMEEFHRKEEEEYKRMRNKTFR